MRSLNGKSVAKISAVHPQSTVWKIARL